jgi:hypothetical protein
MTPEEQAEVDAVCDLGKKLLDEKITPELKARHHLQEVVIDVDTGRFEIARNVLEARRRLNPAPGARLYGARIGDVALWRIGYAGPPQ